MNKISFNLRIDEDLNEKLMIIAKQENRSKNAQIEHIIQTYIQNYEEINSEINISSHDNSTQHISINKK